jgi:hypothetical protein
MPSATSRKMCRAVWFLLITFGIEHIIVSLIVQWGIGIIHIHLHPG